MKFAVFHSVGNTELAFLGAVEASNLCGALEAAAAEFTKPEMLEEFAPHFSVFNGAAGYCSFELGGGYESSLLVLAPEHLNYAGGVCCYSEPTKAAILASASHALA